MKTSAFLLEIGCEEIPAWMTGPALEDLVRRLQEELQARQLAAAEVAAWSTPRRLAVRAAIPSRQPDREDVLTGPPSAMALEPGGGWSRAALGFAAKQGVAPDGLSLIETPKGSYAGIRRRVEGRPAAAILAEILPAVIGAISFPKTMYWREDKFRFIRPLRSLLALLDGAVIPFRLAGVESSDWTFGHRFLGRPRLPVRDEADYREQLAANGVIPDPSARREKIERELGERARQAGLEVIPDPALLEDTVYLHEYPSVIAGGFDPRFLAIPREVLVTVMRKHQKYFSLKDPAGGLAPGFLAVINLDGDRDGLIRTGHERVLKARLTDAEFFWTHDRKTTLESRIPGLDHILFQEQLGSYREKTVRLRQLCQMLSDAAGLTAEARRELDQAASVCKADLGTEMVKELTELQGIMGGLYARAEGYSGGAWQSIYEHYQPAGQEDPVPASAGGALLSIADKADTTGGMLGLGHAPTGSRDPFGLRRCAAGIYRILLEKNLPLDLRPVFARVFELLADRLTQPEAACWSSLEELLAARIRFIFQNAGFRYDEINAVLEKALYQPVDARRRLEALLAIRQVEAFQSIFTARKRIRNILEKQGRDRTGCFDPALIQEEEERELLTAATEYGPPAEAAGEAGNYPEALRLIGCFAIPVDRFFDKVLVMHPDPAIRNNRLLLLEQVGRIFDGFCDFSKFVIETQ